MMPAHSESTAEDIFYNSLVTDYVDLDPQFVERAWLAERIEQHLSDPACRFVLLTAEPGAGKTVFMAWLARRHPDRLRYFIRRDSQTPLSSGDAQSLLFSLGQQLAVLRPGLFHPKTLLIEIEQQVRTIDSDGRVIGIHVQDLKASPFYATALKVEQKAELVAGDLIGIDADRIELEPRLLESESLQHLALLGPALAQDRIDPTKQIVVLIDAVDELRYRSGENDVLNWLASCPQLPQSLRIIVTSRPDDERLARFRGAQQRWLREETVDHTSDEVRADLRRFFEGVISQPAVASALAAHRLDHDRFLTRAVAKADGNFQYLAALTRVIEQATANMRIGDRGPRAEELNDRDSPIDLGQLLRLEGIPSGLPDLYAFFLTLVRDKLQKGNNSNVEVGGQNTARVWAPAWPALYQPILGLLAVAQEPLQSAQLRELGGLQIEDRWVDNALGDLGQFLERDSAGHYRLYHASFAEFLVAASTRAKYSALHLNAAEWNGRIVDQALAVHQAGGSWLAATEYIRTHLATHAAGARRLDALLEDAAYLSAADPGPLLRVLPAATTSRAITAERLLQRVGSRLRGRPIAERVAVIELAARQTGADCIADRLAELQLKRPWSTRWAHPHPTRTDRLLGTHNGQVDAIAIGERDGQAVVVSGGHDEMLRVWDLRSGEQLLAWRHGEGAVEAVAVGELPDGPVVISGGEDKRVRCWSLADGTPRYAPLTGHQGGIKSVAVGDFAGRPVILSGGQEDLAVYVWDLGTGDRLYVLEAESGDQLSRSRSTVYAVAAGTCYGQPVIVAGHDDGMHIWAWTGSRWTSMAPLDSPARTVWAVAIGNLNGQPVATCGESNGRLTTWRLEDGEAAIPPLMSPDHSIIGLAVGQLGQRTIVVTGKYFGRDPGILRVWDLGETERPLRGALDGHHAGVRGLAISQVEGRSVLVSGGFDHTVRVWDLATGIDHERQRSRFPHNHWLVAPTLAGVPVVVSQSLLPVDDPNTEFDPRDTEIPSVSDLVEMSKRVYVRIPRVKVWNRADGAPIESQPLQLDAIGHIEAAGVVGEQVLGVTSSNQRLQAWDLQTGGRMGHEIPTGERFKAPGNVAVGAVGGHAVVAFCDQQARLQVWDLHDGSRLYEPSSTYDGGADCWAFGAPAGRPVAAVGTFGKFGLWEPGRVGPLAEPPAMQREGHMGGAAAVGELAGQPVVVYTNYGRPLFVWDLATSRERAIHIDAEILTIKIAPNSMILAGGPAGLLALTINASFFASPVQI